MVGLPDMSGKIFYTCLDECRKEALSTTSRLGRSDLFSQKRPAVHLCHGFQE